MGTSIAVPHAAGLVALGGRRLLNVVVEDLSTSSSTATTHEARVQAATTLQAATNFTLSLPIMAAAANHMCAILQRNSLKCWENNNAGQLGIERTSNMGDSVSNLGINLPWVDLGPGRTVLQVALSILHMCPFGQCVDVSMCGAIVI
jgi:hypothetical protein